MTPLTLTLRPGAPEGIDMSPVTPDRLRDTNIDKISSLQLDCGGFRLRLGEAFAIKGADTGRIEIRNPGTRLERLGHGMASGHLTVHGDCGHYTGMGMKGGHIEITGNAGDFLGAGMAGGSINVKGSAGRGVGATCSGALTGMKGGLIHIRGSAGERAGERMRGGIIVIGRDAGAYTAHRMLAGTIVVLGVAGPHAALAMKRGTLILARTPAKSAAIFSSSGELRMTFLQLLFTQLGLSGLPVAALARSGWNATRLHGDRSFAGKGEILLLSARR